MTNLLTFKTPARRKEAITFLLDGEEYHFTPPKTAGLALDVIFPATEGAVDITAVRVLFDWFGQGLPEEENARLIARLRDPDDDLDIDQLREIVDGLMGEIANRPTTLPPG